MALQRTEDDRFLLPKGPRRDTHTLASSNNRTTPLKTTQTLTSQQIINILRHAQRGGNYGREQEVLLKSAPIHNSLDVSTKPTEGSENVHRQSIENHPNAHRTTIIRSNTKKPVPPSLFNSFLEGLKSLPVIGNVLKASVDPVYRP